MWKLYIAATLEKRIAWISEPVLRLKSRDVVFEIKNTCAIAKKKRSLGFVKDGKVEAGKVWRSLNKMFLKPMLSGGTSVIAVNEKDEIVGEHT